MSLSATLQRTTQRTTALSQSERETVAKVLTWDTQREVSPNEIEAIAIQHDILWIRLMDDRAIPLHVETFRAIRAAQALDQAEPTGDDIEVAATPASNSGEHRGNFEVDSDGNQPYPTYRVWEGMEIIGTFCRSSLDGKWLAFPKYGRARCRYNTPDEATAAIVEAWNKATVIRSADQGLSALAMPTPGYNANPIGRRGAADNWKAFQASGKKLDLTGDSMQKWREIEIQQNVAQVVNHQPKVNLEAA
jgi:hypothetical protein